jgi:hypothetical protein
VAFSPRDSTISTSDLLKLSIALVMLLQSAFLTDYLAESNLVLTQEDYGNKLFDFLSPIRAFLHKDQEILSFSLARYAGADSRIAFFCQWFYHTLQITRYPHALLEEDRQYFRKKVPIRLRGVPNLYDLVDKDITEVILPEQIAFMNSKTRLLIDDILVKNDFLAKYLSSSFLSQFTASELLCRKRLYAEEVSLNQYMEAQSFRLSYAAVCLPTLLGMCYSFHQPENPVNPKAIKWALLEEVLKSIAILHQTQENSDLAEFAYFSRLSEREQFNWLQITESERKQVASTNPEVVGIVNQMRERFFQKALHEFEVLILPDKDRQIIRDLIDWAYGT